MKNRRNARQPHIEHPVLWIGVVCVFLLLFFLMAGNVKTSEVVTRIKYRVSAAMLHELSPVSAGKQKAEEIKAEGIPGLILSEFPISRYGFGNTSYRQASESSLDGELLAAGEQEEEPEEAWQNAVPEESIMASHNVAQTSVWAQTEKQVTYAMEKLQDFDYLKQNFYTIDRTTTIDSSELNVDTLMGMDCRLSEGADGPQILIYHTHSQEKYADSTEGDASTGVVGVGEYLTQILQDTYGLNVMHHTGEYDVQNRDKAYSVAGPALEQILAENPSIEVVIDLHRDGVSEGTHLTTEVNGVTMAPIMFFNGLSRTTSTGNIDYLYNPNLSANLAFSFQMQLAANEYFPGFARPIYLKGYRYNLHYCPKSLLVEVGAQTNTVQEAMNAMEPLAAVLNHVLTGE